MTAFNPLTAAYLRPTRKIGVFSGYVVESESADDELEITSHPVQSGADISDHAFKKPSTLQIKCLFGGLEYPSPAEAYTKLLAYQADREPFSVVTGKRLYKNMLIQSISQTTDSATEYILSVSLTLIEVRIAGVAWTKLPAKTLSPAAKQSGKATTQKAGQKQTKEPAPAARRTSSLGAAL